MINEIRIPEVTQAPPNEKNGPPKKTRWKSFFRRRKIDETGSVKSAERKLKVRDHESWSPHGKFAITQNQKSSVSKSNLHISSSEMISVSVHIRNIMWAT